MHQFNTHDKPDSLSPASKVGVGVKMKQIYVHVHVCRAAYVPMATHSTVQAVPEDGARFDRQALVSVKPEHIGEIN